MQTNNICLSLATALAAAAGFSAPATAQVVDTKGTVGYVIDQRAVVARSGTGLCWRTGFWTPALAIAECDPDLVKKPEPAPAPAPAPAPVEAPKPAPAPAAAPAAPKKCDFAYTLKADETFVFNKADLTAAAKAQLDKEVIGKLGTCSEVKLVLVTGHTDRLGSQQYNQKLSEKRAEAVAAYLGSKGVSKDALETMGAGKTQSVKGCDDKLPRKQLIECLAPNRRVVVEVKGPAK